MLTRGSAQSRRHGPPHDFMKKLLQNRRSHLSGKIAWAVVILTALVGILVGSFVLRAHEGEVHPPSNAKVVTDKADYPPGATAHITSTGFQPNEFVKLQVLHTHSADGT